MKDLYESNTKIQIHWLEDLQRILKEQGHAYTQGDGGHIDNMRPLHDDTISPHIM